MTFLDPNIWYADEPEPQSRTVEAIGSPKTWAINPSEEALIQFCAEFCKTITELEILLDRLTGDSTTRPE